MLIFLNTLFYNQYSISRAMKLIKEYKWIQHKGKEIELNVAKQENRRICVYIPNLSMCSANQTPVSRNTGIIP